MDASLDAVGCASLPPSQLAGLAAVRCLPIEVSETDDLCWLRWTPGENTILQCVLPLPGVVLYVQRAGHWFRLGSRLPVAGPPVTPAPRPLQRVLVPEPAAIANPLPYAPQPVALRLVRDERPRPATALLTTLDQVRAWADQGTTAQIERVHGAVAGQRVLLVGERLPWFPRSERCWGRRLLIALGFRPDPNLPEAALLEALPGGADHFVIVRAEGIERLPVQVVQPLTRAGLRLAGQERRP